MLPFLCCFQNLHLLVIKKKLKSVLVNCTSICMSSKILSHIFKIIFQTRNIKFFVLLGASFSRYIQLKGSFSDEKISTVIFETHFSSEAIRIKCCKVLKESFIIGRCWSSAKLFIMQNYIDNANGDVP